MKHETQQHRRPAHLDRTKSAGISLILLIASLLLGMALAALPIWIPGLAIALTGLLIVRGKLLYAIVIFALAVGYKLFAAWRMNAAQSGFTASDILFALSMLLFIASAMQYVELAPRRFRWPGVGFDNDSWDSRKQYGSTKAVLRGLSSSLLRMPVALLLVLGLLAVLPVEVFWPNPYGFDPAVYRTVCVVWLFVVALVIPVSVALLLKWRSLQPRQASIYLRRALAGEVRREQRLVERARHKRQQKFFKRQR